MWFLAGNELGPATLIDGQDRKVLMQELVAV